MSVHAPLLGAWSPGLGDPSFVGWLTVAAYAATAWSTWRALRAALAARRAGERGAAVPFWRLLFVGTLALGVNKQLDLQSGLVDLGRSLARSQGWYENRVVVQVGFVALGVLLCAGLCAWLAYVARHERRRVLVALVGWTLLCVFVAIRALSFHHVDRILGLDAGGARVGAFLELAGIATVAIGAATYVRDRRTIETA